MPREERPPREGRPERERKGKVSTRARLEMEAKVKADKEEKKATKDHGKRRTKSERGDINRHLPKLKEKSSASVLLRSEDPMAKKQKRMGERRHRAVKERWRKVSPWKMWKSSLTKFRGLPRWKRGASLGGARRAPI